MWRLPTLPGLNQVPSAERGLTSLFGMGRGEHPSYGRHQVIWMLSVGLESGEAKRRTVPSYGRHHQDL